MGYANFGNEAKDLNKQLVKDIDDCMSKHTGKDRTFRKNNSGWQSNPYLEDMYESFEHLRTLIDSAAKPVLGHSGVTDETLPHIRTEGMWANVCFDVGGYSRPHIHGAGRTLWSGVYYPQGLEEVDDLDNFEEQIYTSALPLTVHNFPSKRRASPIWRLSQDNCSRLYLEGTLQRTHKKLETHYHDATHLLYLQTP